MSVEFCTTKHRDSIKTRSCCVHVFIFISGALNSLFVAKPYNICLLLAFFMLIIKSPYHKSSFWAFRELPLIGAKCMCICIYRMRILDIVRPTTTKTMYEYARKHNYILNKWRKLIEFSFLLFIC